MKRSLGLFALILGLISVSVAVAVPRVQAPLQFAIIGDGGEWGNEAKSVRDSIIRHGVTSLILPGDNLYNALSGYPNTWNPWSSLGLKFDVVAIGNHNGGYAQEVSFFRMPGEFYSKTFENTVRFIVLNSDNDRTGRQQAQWLDQQLASATEPFIFLVYHHPSFTVSKKHTWDEKPNFQTPLRTQLLWKYRSKLTGVLVGHDHLATLVTANDLPMVVSGAVHEVREDKPVNYRDGNIPVKTAWYFDNRLYWVKLGFDVPTGSAILDFVRAADSQSQCTARLVTGKAMQLAPNCARLRQGE